MASDDTTQAIRGVAQQIGELKIALDSAFPQQLGTAASATGGAATLPANPVGFLSVVLTTGEAVKIPYYT